MSAMVLLVIAGCTVAVFYQPNMWPWISGFAILSLILQWLLWRSVASPLHMVENGYALLLSQDFNSRLRDVGEYHADKVAQLFNRMASELKNERMRLSEQEGFLRQLVDVSPMGVVVLDFDNRITMMNRSFKEMANIPGTPESMEGESLYGADSELMEEIKKIKEGANSIVRLSDTCIYRVSRLSFMEMGFRRPFILVESLTDEIVKAERSAYEKVIRVISHEVNNTMGGVSSILDMISETSDDEEMHLVIESGEERCRSLSRFIRNYAEVVKLADPVVSRRDINEEILRPARFLKTIVGDNIKLKYHLAGHELNVKVDSLMWEQVMINLVKNAAESVSEKMKENPSHDGQVIVSTYEDKRRAVCVEVADNGKGIDLETSKKLFTPFFSTKSNGQGIGLTLVSEILSRHGCRFSLRTGSDGFTRFRILFPR